MKSMAQKVSKTVFVFPGECQSCYVAQVDLVLLILLLQPTKCQGHRTVGSHWPCLFLSTTLRDGKLDSCPFFLPFSFTLLYSLPFPSICISICLFLVSASLCSTGLELAILLPQLSQCWDYRCALPHPVWELESFGKFLSSPEPQSRKESHSTKNPFGV
jgi:hypothetical protein